MLAPIMAEENKSFEYETINAFLSDIPAIDKELKSDKPELPSVMGFLAGKGNILINLTVNETSRPFYVTIQEKRIVGVAEGIPEKTNYVVDLNEETANQILQSEDKVDSIMKAYDESNMELGAHGFTSKIKLFFVRIYLWFA